MTAKTLTISMSEKDFNYLKQDAHLKPSHIFQVALKQIKENRSSLKEQNELLLKKCNRLQEELFKLQEEKNA